MNTCILEPKFAYVYLEMAKLADCVTNSIIFQEMAFVSITKHKGIHHTFILCRKCSANCKDFGD